MKTEMHERIVIWTLLANLIGPEGRIYEMGEFKIEPEMLPEDMLFERTVLELIYLYNQAPSREALLTHMKLSGIKDADERLDKILSYRTSDGAIAPLAAPLKNWAEKRAIRAALLKAQAELESGKVDNHEIYRAITSQIIGARPSGQHGVSALTSHERYERWKQKQLQRASGDKTSLGPRWPFPSLNLLLPVIRPSDLTILTAQTKHGKSTLGTYFAEQFAWKQGFEVIVYQFETDHESFQERQIARHVGIPINYQRMPKLVNPESTEEKAYLPDGRRTSFKALFSIFEKHLEEWEKIGSITYQHTPEWTIDELALDIEIMRQNAILKGRQLVVIIDHLSAIPKPQAREERVALDKLYEELKKIPERYSETPHPVYLIVLDQEKREEERSLGNTPEEIMKNLNRIRTRGTSTGIIRSQAHLSLQRTLADADASVYVVSPTGQRVQAKNAVGMPRYYYRAKTLGPARLFVVHANDGATGWIDLQIENELFRVEEAATQSCAIIKERSREEEAMLRDFGLAS